MSNDSMQVTEGSGTYVGTSRINEGGQDRHLQRQVPNTSEGEDVSVGSFKEAKASIIRPGNTTVYTPNTAWAASPATTGGITFANAARLAAKSGYVTDLFVFTSAAPGTMLQAELWLFDQAVTAVADNAAFTVSAADMDKCVGVIPFTLVAVGGGGHSFAHVRGLNIGFTTSGAPDLRGLVKVTNAYAPASGEKLSFRLKSMRGD